MGLVEKIVVEVDGRVDGLQQKMTAAGKAVGDFGGKVAGVTGGAGGLDAVLQTVGGRVSGLAGAFTTGAAGAGVLAAACIGVAAEGARMAAAIEASTKRVQSALDLSDADVTGLRVEAETLSTALGVAQTDVARLFEAITKGGPGSAEGLRAIARASLELSAITGDDAGGLANGIDQVLDAFGLVPERAREVAASLYGITRGKVPLDDLFAVLAKVAPTAKAAGLSFTDLTAAAAGLLDAGVSTRRVASELEGLTNSGERGVARIRELAGASRDAVADADVYERALGRATSSTEALARSVREDLRNELIALGDQTLPATVNGLALLRDALAGAREGGAQLGDALAGLKDRLPAWLVKRLEAGGAVLPPGIFALQGLAVAGQYARARDAGVFDGGSPFDPATPTRVPGVTVSADPEEDPAVKRLRAIQAAAKDLAGVSTAQLRAFQGQLDKLREGDAPALAKNEAATLADTLTVELQKRVRTAADTLRAVTAQAQTARQAFASATATASPGAGDNLEAQIARLVTQAQAAKLGAAEIGAMVRDLRAAASDKVVADAGVFVDGLRRELVTGVSAAVRAAEQALDAFDAEVQKRAPLAGLGITNPLTSGATGAQAQVVAQVRAQKVALVEAAKAAADLDRLLQSVDDRNADASQGGNRLAAMRDLNAEADKEQAILARTVKGSAEYEAAKARLATVQVKINALQDANTEAIDASRRAALAVEGSTEKLAFNVATAASVAAGLATAFLGANNEVTHLLGGVAAAAGGIGDLLAKAREAGGLGKLLSSGGGIASAAGALGGIVAGGGAIVAAIKGILGPHEPSAQERAVIAAQQENTAALQKLNTTIGEANVANTGQSTGRAVGVAQGVSDEVRRQTDDFLRREAERQEAEGQAFVPQEAPPIDRRALLDAELHKAGLSFAEFAAIAKRFGITITETGEGLDAFLRAADSVDTRFQSLADDADVFGLTAADRFGAVLRIYAGLNNGVADGARAAAQAILDGFDLTTAAGRDAAVAFVREQYRLGAISADTAKQLLGGIRGIGDEIAADADAAAHKIDAAFATVSDALRRLDFDRQILGDQSDPAERIRQTVAAYADAVPAALKPLFDGLLDGIDLATEEGRAHVKERAQAIYRELVADGTLDDAEQKIAEGLLTIIGSVESFGDDLLAQADRLRDRIVTRARQTSDLRGEDPTERFVRLAQAYGQAFPEIAKLLEGLDLTSTAGIEEARRRLRGLFDTVGDGTQFDPLRGAILDLNTSAQTAADGIAQAAAAIADAASLSSQAAADARRLGLSPEDTARATGAPFQDGGRTLSNGRRVVDEVGQFDFADQQQVATALSKVRTLYANAIADDKKFLGDYLDFLLGLQDANAAAQPDAFVPQAEPQTVENTQFISAAQALTEATGITLADLTRSELVVLRNIEGLVRALAAGTGAPLAPPQLPAPGAYLSPASVARGAQPAGGGVVVNVRVAGPFYGVAPGTVQSLADTITGGVVKAVNDGLGQEWRDTQLASGDNTRGR